MAALAGVVGDRDLVPGQGCELGMKGGLVALDSDQVMRAALGGQVLGVAALGVHRVRGDHRPGQVDAIQQRREHGDLVRLRLDIDLPEDHAAGVLERGQQVPRRTVGHARSAQCLAVHRDHAAAAWRRGGALLGPGVSCSGLVTTPAEVVQEGWGIGRDAGLGGQLLGADGDSG